MPSTYLYRCTEQQLETHLQRIADAGDSVEHVIFKGGRDYVLVVRKPTPHRVVIAEPSPEFTQALAAAVRHALGAAPLSPSELLPDRGIPSS